MPAETVERHGSDLKKNVTLAAIVAGVSGIVGLISSVLTLYSQADSVVSAAIRRDFAPIGTIISSALDPKEFAKAIGENEGDAYNRRKWILADGREVIDTAYARTTGNKPVPDLRGRFLRGIDNRKSDRTAGDFQSYSTALPRIPFTGITSPAGAHDHDGGAGFNPRERYDSGARNYPVPGPTKTGVSGDHSHSITVTGGGDSETRPDNVAVYYYIKIN